MLKLEKVLEKDLATGTTKERWKYTKARFLGPFIFFNKWNHENGDVYVKFCKGILVDDVKYMTEEDTKINLVAKAISEIVATSPHGAVTVSILGEDVHFYSTEINIILPKITEVILRKFDNF